MLEKFEDIPNLLKATRRTALRLTAIGASTLALFGCGEKEDAGVSVNTLQKEVVEQQLKGEGIRKIGGFTSKDGGGLRFKIYSDGKINTNNSAIEESSFSVFNISRQDITETTSGIPNSKAVTELTLDFIQKLKDSKNKGTFRGKTYSLLLSSERDTCVMSSDNSKRTSQQQGSNTSTTYSFIRTKNETKADPNCDFTALTPYISTAYGSTQQSIGASDNLISIIPSSTYKNSINTLPSFGGFKLNARENTKAGLAHESVHALARIAGLTITENEETIVQTIEATAVRKFEGSPPKVYPVQY